MKALPTCAVQAATLFAIVREPSECDMKRRNAPLLTAYLNISFHSTSRFIT